MTYLPRNLRHRFDFTDFLQKGGKKKRAEMIARNLANRSEMELLPPERITPELLMSQQSSQTQAAPIQPNTQFIDNLQVRGNNPSLVDYLNSTGRASSLSARRDLGATYGINDIGTAEGNTRLLKILQEQDDYKPTRQVRKAVYNLDRELIKDAERAIKNQYKNLERDLRKAADDAIAKNAKPETPFRDRMKAYIVAGKNYTPPQQSFVIRPNSNPVTTKNRQTMLDNIENDSYREAVLMGNLRGRDLAKLRDEGKISPRRYNELYSLLRQVKID